MADDNYNYQSLGQQDEYDPANIAQHDEEEEEEDDYDPSNLHFGDNGADSTEQQEPQAEEDDEEAEDVEMDAQDSSPEPEPSAQSSTESTNLPVHSQAPPKQRTVGGFVVDDDDEDDEDMPMAGTSGQQLNEAESGNATPNNTLPTQDTSIDKAAQDQGHEDSGAAVPLDHHALSNGAEKVSSTTEPALSTIQTSLPVPSPVTKAPVQSTSSSVPLPKARLPQDKVGILEDRIADDPRGDIDAWMNLINEHQRRSKFDDARAVYDRFLQIFPFAVSSGAQWDTWAC